MNFSSVSVSLKTYLGYMFLLDVSIFTTIHDEKEAKINSSFFKHFFKNSKVEEKVSESHKQCWLTITWKLNKIELHTNSEDWHFRNQTTLAAFFCTKFTFDNLNSACLEYFLFYPNNRLVHLQILSYRDLFFSLD